nr:MAG TPA: hypothetical protein [Crassvirales sp.]
MIKLSSIVFFIFYRFCWSSIIMIYTCPTSYCR